MHTIHVHTRTADYGVGYTQQANLVKIYHMVYLICHNSRGYHPLYVHILHTTFVVNLYYHSIL